MMKAKKKKSKQYIMAFNVHNTIIIRILMKGFNVFIYFIFKENKKEIPS
jgi:hypothetical protein